MSDVKHFMPGQILLLSCGAYSSYEIIGTARVLQPFTSTDVTALAKQKALTVQRQSGIDILALLIEATLVEEAENRELHEDDWGCDSYGTRQWA